MKKLILFLAIISITACALRYKPGVSSFTPGYFDERLGENTYNVKVGKAEPKDWRNLEKFALYRASEITQENGGRYFAVLYSSTRIDQHTVKIPTTTTTTGTATVIGDTVHVDTTSTTTGGESVDISGGWYILDFKIISQEDFVKYRYVVDSQSVISDLKDFIDKKR